MWWQKVTLLSALVIFCVVRGNPLYNDVGTDLLADPPKTYRLPNDTIPTSYNIVLQPTIKEGDFSLLGEVSINVKVIEDTNTVTVHSHELNITKLSVVSSTSGEPIVFTNYELITTHDFLVINLQNTVQAGTELRIDIAYSGKLRNDGTGFFWSNYTNSAGENKFYGATQFEIFDARSAFPCYDEPGIRAKVTLTIIHDKSLTAVANTEVSIKLLDTTGTKYITQFATTPEIQTYLIAFLVSDFEYVNATNSRIPQKVYGTPVAIQDGQGDFAAAVVGPILAKLEEKFNVSYPLTKMDHVAIVSQFSFSAMENIGLIIYINSGLLLSPTLSESAKFNKQSSIISLITHEYSHQWFGNIVSPKWWQYTWLNEGFATFFANYIPDLIYPDRKSMRNYFSSTIQTAFSNDGIGAWSMNHYTEDPKELWTKFNRIGYQKSGCVIRMYMEVMTEPVFFKALNYYLTENYMKAASPNELHNNLQKAFDEAFPDARIHFGDSMSTWENQAGYPLISVSVSGSNLVFSQRRYPESTGEVYSVPITFATKTKPDFSVKTPKVWLPLPTMSFDQAEHGYSPADWMVVNIDQVGYYRVDYDTTLWHANIEQLNKDHKVINELNRALLLDEFYLAWTEFNRVNGADALYILSYFDKEDEYLAWARAYNTFHQLKRRLFGTPAYEKFTEFIRSRAKPHLESLGYEGFDGEDSAKMSLRSYIKEWSCQSLDGNCFISDYQKFLNYYNQGGEPNFNYCYAMQLVEESIFGQILMDATTKNDYPNREGFVQNLGCSRNSVNLYYLQAQILNSLNNLSKNEREKIIISMFSNSEVGLEMTMKFVDTFHAQLSSIVDLSMIMNTMSGYINGQEKTASFRAIIEKLKSTTILTDEHDKSIKSTLESNEKWNEDNYGDIEVFFGIKKTTERPTEEPTTTTTTTTTTTESPTTTPDSGTSIVISIGLITLCVVMNLMK